MINSGPSAFLKNEEETVKKALLKIPSEMRYIREVSSKILESLISYKIDEDKLFDIRLCVEEAVRNAIQHGNKLDKSLTVKVRYWVEGDAFNAEVEDEGRGFDYRKLPDPTTNENVTKGSGRGVYIIHHLMDEVEHSETGNKIRMKKLIK